MERVQRMIETLQRRHPVLDDQLVPPPSGREVRLPETAGGAVESEPRLQGADEAEPAQVDLPPFQPGTSSLPALLNEAGAREMIRGHYPRSLQEVGIGGTVNLLLWVDENGSADNVQVAGSSRVPDLDRAALEAAPGLRFSPAMREGVPVGMWVEFDVVFESRPMSGIRRVPEPL